MSKDTGGAAFPTDNERQTGPSSYHYEGMTLRDYAQIRFMAAIIQGHVARNGSDNYIDPKFVEDWATNFTDEFLAERSKTGG